jgi:hypothetical protein
LFQHVHTLRKLREEVILKEVENPDEDGIAQRVEDLVARLAVHDDAPGAEHGEVLGGIGLFDGEAADEVAGREFAVAKGFNDGDAGGVGEGLKDIGFELAESLHRISIFHITNIRKHVSGS